MATEGGDSPAVEASGAPARPDAADADVVITTVVSADDPRPATAPPPAPEADDAGDDLEWVWADDDGDDHLRPPSRPEPEATSPA
ncbi:MAG: hypothetical protein Q8K72_15330, partial [Acidimicrobiales bacterium]|nr:hypothetical protein [Acidimicrobiales bacterium]